MTSCIHASSDLAAASGLLLGENPPYALDNFKKVYPQFFGEGKVPEEVLQIFINLANASIMEKRWHEAWAMGMGWFVAHFSTLYLQGTADPNSSAGQVIAAGNARGLQTSKSVGDVSVSYDYSSVANDLDGWAAWKLTVYGTQLATYAKMISRGGMYAV